MDELEAALREEVDRLRTELVSEEEMERVRNQVVASKVYERDSVFYQAMQLGVVETVGLDWRLLDDYVDRIRAVTPEQIREVARTYLVDKNLTVGTLNPLPPDEGRVAASPSPHAGGRHVR